MARMSATKLRELFSTVGVFNPHNFAAVEGAPVYVSYRKEESGRAYQSAAWQVIRVGLKTDPDAHWRDQGNATFGVYRRDQKATQEVAAKAWASERYGVTEWAKTPYGTWMDKTFVEKRVAELTARAAERSAVSS